MTSVTPDSGRVDDERIRDAVREVAAVVEDDGAYLSLDYVEATSIRLRLVLDPTTCDVDCIVPTPMIAQMVATAVERATGTAYEVAIDVAAADDS
jgi:hypothetical protein